jgi:hypothetical protein
MDDVNFFDVFTNFILVIGQIANFGIGIQLFYIPESVRVIPTVLNYVLTAIFGFAMVGQFIIQVGLIKHSICDQNKEKEKIWKQYDINYTQFLISLFFITFVELLAEGYDSLEDITGYNQATLLQILVFSRIFITFVLFIFNFYIYQKKIDNTYFDSIKNKLPT